MPVASFCASETAETGRIANGREQGDHVSRRQESYKVFCPTFCTLQKVGKRSRRRRRKKPRSGKGFNWVSAKFWFCALIRGLQNLESPFGKVLILFVRSRHCDELNRGLENLERSRKGNGFWYFLRRAKSTANTRRGLRPSGLPGTIQSSAEEYFSKFFRRHVSNPVFRARRRRKGFESVRRSGVTA